MKAVMELVAIDQASLIIARNSSNITIECHQAASAALSMHGSDSVISLEIAQIFVDASNASFYNYDALVEATLL